MQFEVRPASHDPFPWIKCDSVLIQCRAGTTLLSLGWLHSSSPPFFILSHEAGDVRWKLSMAQIEVPSALVRSWTGGLRQTKEFAKVYDPCLSCPAPCHLIMTLHCNKNIFYLFSTSGWFFSILRMGNSTVAAGTFACHPECFVHIHPFQKVLRSTEWRPCESQHLKYTTFSLVLCYQRTICITSHTFVILVWQFLLTLFYTRGLEIVILHVIVPQPYRFSPCFFTYVW
jgi:hypothetical protein